MEPEPHPEQYHLFSEEAHNNKTFVEGLSTSLAFEQAMYENRITRIATYKSPANSTEGTPSSTIQLPPYYITLQFPPELHDSFSKLSYEVTDLSVHLEDSPGEAKLEVHFKADGATHGFNMQKAEPDEISAFHSTTNEAGDFVQYEIPPHVPVSVLAALAYAQQQTINGEGASLSLDEQTIFTPRDDTINLAERIITTLGDFSGVSTVHTTALFENSNESPIIAELSQGERPDRSTSENLLTLSEILGGELPIASSTKLVQRCVNIESGTPATPTGQFNLRFATQEDTVLSQNIPPVTREFHPDIDPEAWSRICMRFAHSAKIAMAPHLSLDDPY